MVFDRLDRLGEGNRVLLCFILLDERRSDFEMIAFRRPRHGVKAPLNIVSAVW